MIGSNFPTWRTQSKFPTHKAKSTAILLHEHFYTLAIEKLYYIISICTCIYIRNRKKTRSYWLESVSEWLLNTQHKRSCTTQTLLHNTNALAQYTEMVSTEQSSNQITHYTATDPVAFNCDITKTDTRLQDISIQSQHDSAGDCTPKYTLHHYTTSSTVQHPTLPSRILDDASS